MENCNTDNVAVFAIVTMAFAVVDLAVVHIVGVAESLWAVSLHYYTWE